TRDSGSDRMSVDAWGFDVERQTAAHRLRSLHIRLSAIRTAVAAGLTLAFVLGGAGALRDWVVSFRVPSWVAAVMFLVLLFAVVLAFLAPIVLVPLFFRFRPLEDPSLRARFESLAAQANVPIVGVFELHASEKTRRSNAAVMGLGRTRRVVVTDTLLRDFRPEEIETVLAHELAHQKFLDPLRGFVLGSVTSLVILAVGAWLYSILHSSFGI